MLPLSRAEITALQQEDSSDATALLFKAKFLILVDLDFNPLNKTGLLRQLKEQSGSPTTMPLVETYQGVEIHKLAKGACSSPDQPEIYLTLLGGTAAVALDPAPLHGAIERFKKPGGSLQDSADFQALDKELPTDRLGTLYLNLTAIYDSAQAVIPADATGGVTMSRTDGAIAIALSAHDDGVQIDSASNTRVEGQTLTPPTAPNADVLNDVPNGSWGFYAGSDLKSTIQQALAIMRKQSTGPDNMVDLDAGKRERRIGL